MERIWGGWSRAIAVSAVLVSLLAACTRPIVPLRQNAASAPSAAELAINPQLTIHGHVDWGSGRQTQTTIGEIATGATVSFIDATTGQTVTTSVTSSTGGFTLQFSSNFVPDSSKAYYIEAVKGLMDGGAPNRAGAPAARVRTIGYFVQGNWSWMTGAGLNIDRATTALCVIASLRNFAVPGAVDYHTMLGCLKYNGGVTPDVFTPGSTNISSSEFTTVFNFVTSALDQNLDPIAAIQLTSINPPNYGMAAPPVSVTGVVPASGHIGDTVVIQGSNFSATPGANAVFFNGVQAATPSVNAQGTTLSVAVPPGATTGQLTIQTGNVVLGNLSFNVLSWDGHTPFDTSGNLYVSANAINAVFQIPPAGGATRWLTTTDYSLLSAPAGITVDATNNVYVANSGNNTILKVTPAKAVTVYASGGGLNNPQALAFDRTGNLYVANRGGKNILVVPPGGGTPTQYFADPSLDPAGLAFDASYSLWVSNPSANSIQEIATASLALTTPVVGLNQPYGVAFDAGGNLYAGNFGQNQVVRFSTAGSLSPYITNPGVHTGIRDVAFNTNGVFYVGAYTSHTIFSIDTHGAVQNLALAPTNAWNIARDGAGNLYFGENNQTQRFPGRNANGYVYVAPWNSGLNTYDPFIPLVGGFSSPSGVGFDSSGHLYVGDEQTQRVYQVNVSTRVKTLYTSGFACNGPVSLAFDHSNTLLSGDRNCYGQTVTTGGAWSNYSQGRRPQAVVGDGTNLYVAALDRGTISKIHHDSTNNVDLTDLYMTGLSNPYGMAYSGGALYVAEAGAGRITKITGAGASSTWVSGLNSPVAIVFDGSGNAYIATQGDNKVWKVPAGTSTPSLFATGLNSPNAMVLFNSTLFTTNNGDFTIKQIPLSTGLTSSLATVSTGTAFLWGLAVDGSGTLYAGGTSANQGGGSQTNVVFTVPSTGGTPTQLISVGRRIAGLWYGAYNGTSQLFATSYALSSAPNHMLLQTYSAAGAYTGSLGAPMYFAIAMTADSSNRLIGSSGRYSPVITRWVQGANGYGTNFFILGSLGGNGAAQVYDDASDNVYAARTTSGIYKFAKSSDYSFAPTVLGGANLTNSSGVVGDSSGNLWVASMGGSLDNVPFLEIPSGQTNAVLVPNWIYDPQF